MFYFWYCSVDDTQRPSWFHIIYIDMVMPLPVCFVGGGRGGGEHERSKQEKEARVGWVKRQIPVGIVV